MFLQILRFTLAPALTISSAEFQQLRKVATTAGALSQFFGYTLQTRIAPVPKERHEITWVIEWPHRAISTELQSALAATTDGARELIVEIDSRSSSTLINGLASPVCELVVMALKPEAPLSDSSLQDSVHKAYTDCYRMQGFVAGGWGYAVNTDSADGTPIQTGEKDTMSAKRLAVYLLGWESIEFHEDASKGPVFAEEMQKLAKWIEPASGAWYANLQRA